MQATGDTWNYVNNAQARLGVSAMINTLLVWPAAAAAVAVYFQVRPPLDLGITATTTIATATRLSNVTRLANVWRLKL